MANHRNTETKCLARTCLGDTDEITTRFSDGNSLRLNRCWAAVAHLLEDIHSGLKQAHLRPLGDGTRDVVRLDLDTVHLVPEIGDFFWRHGGDFGGLSVEVLAEWLVLNFFVVDDWRLLLLFLGSSHSEQIFGFDRCLLGLKVVVEHGCALGCCLWRRFGKTGHEGIEWVDVVFLSACGLVNLHLVGGLFSGRSFLHVGILVRSGNLRAALLELRLQLLVVLFIVAAHVVERSSVFFLSIRQNVSFIDGGKCRESLELSLAGVGVVFEESLLGGLCFV